MTRDRASDDDAALDAALGALGQPTLPRELEARLRALPERTNVRRFPGRSWRVSAFGWAAAAALGLFIGAQSAELGSGDVAAVDDNGVAEQTDDEDETLALAVGSFAEIGEEP